MLNEDTQKIAVIASKEQSRVFLASVTASMILDTVTHHGRRFHISTRPPGMELIFDENEDLSVNSAAADDARKSYSLLTALQTPEAIPDELSLSVCTEENKQFCGRILFHCCDAQEQFPADAVLILLHEDNPELLPEKILSSVPGVCIAVECAVPPEERRAEDFVREHLPDLHFAAQMRHGGFYWYHPKGFQQDGTVHPDEDAVPYGIPDVFWNTVQTAADMHLESLQRTAMENRNIIRRRNSIFQKNSPRRILELNRARAAYSAAVQCMYGTEQLLAAATGRPLAEDKKE